MTASTFSDDSNTVSSVDCFSYSFEDSVFCGFGSVPHFWISAVLTYSFFFSSSFIFFDDGIGFDEVFAFF
jgi:hypothetical protein